MPIKLDFERNLSVKTHKNIISWYQIFYAWLNSWRHQSLCLKLRYWQAKC